MFDCHLIISPSKKLHVPIKIKYYIITCFSAPHQEATPGLAIPQYLLVHRSHPDPIPTVHHTIAKHTDKEHVKIVPLFRDAQNLVSSAMMSINP